FPIAGADLIALGVRPGPEIGRRLALARRLWLEQGCPEGEATREALLRRATA
ncbi:MAG: Polynucleotide adenylyltransferase region, partial [Methylobacterium sp.]|nr:Polynucleotide adenylyltransferase region [Methylobacterium sp.]